MAGSSEHTVYSGVSTTPEDLHQFVRDVYVWGWPMVNVYNRMVFSDKIPDIARRMAPAPVARLNEIAMLADYLTPHQRAIACPNHDVAYGFGMFDFTRSPVVIQVPDFGDRFWLIQLGDIRTDGFGRLGSRYGSRPGFYLLTGPEGTNADCSPFQDVFRCPTQIGYSIPRVFLKDTDEDRDAIQGVVNGIAAYPLDSFDGTVQARSWSRQSGPPMQNLEQGELAWVVPDKFFDVLPLALAAAPPLPGEEALYATCREVCQLAQRDETVRGVLRAAAVQAEQELIAPLLAFRNIGQARPHHWTTFDKSGDWGNSYLDRAAAAKSNIFVARRHEAVYFYQDLDDQGVRLNGANRYRMTFPPGASPPVQGFWSVTLYDENHLLVPHAQGRYSVGSKTPSLMLAADGSLTIEFGAIPPADSNFFSNWLSTPQGDFSLYCRCFGPDDRILHGAWTPPPVVRCETSWR